MKDLQTNNEAPIPKSESTGRNYGISALSKILDRDKVRTFTKLGRDNLEEFIKFCLIDPRKDWDAFVRTDIISSLDPEVLFAMGVNPATLNSGMKISMESCSEFYGVPYGVSIQHALVRLKTISPETYYQFIKSLNQNKQVRNGFDGNKLQLKQNFADFSDVIDELGHKE